MAEFLDNYPFTATITPDTSAYADGDVVGGVLTFQTEGRVKGGVFTHVRLADDDSEGAAYRLYLYHDQPSTIADNAAFTLSLADEAKLIGWIDIASSGYLSIGTTRVTQVVITSAMGSVQPYWLNRLYGYLVTNGSTPTFASDKTINISILQSGAS